MNRDTRPVDFPPDIHERAEAAVPGEIPDPEQMSPEDIRKLIHNLRVNCAERDLQIDTLRRRCMGQEHLTVDARNVLASGKDRKKPPEVNERHLQAIVPAMIGLIFLADTVIPLGYAVWIFYTVPLLLTSRLSRKGTAHLAAAVIMIATAAGIFIGPVAMTLQVALFNRTAGVIAMWAIAILLEKYRFTRQLRVLAEELSIARDLAEQRAREAEEGRRILDGIMEFVPEEIQVVARDHTVVRDSRYSLVLTGHSEKDVRDASFEEQLHQIPIFHLDGETPARTDELPAIRAIEYGQVVKDEEWNVQTARGDMIRIAINAGPLRGRNGEITGAVSTWHDITEQKRTEEELRKTKDELEEQVWRRTVDLEKTIENLRREVSEREKSENELAKYREHLEELVRERTTRLREEIEERKRVESNLRESEERFRLALENSATTVFSQDRALRYTWMFNPLMVSDGEEYIGKMESDLLAPRDAGFFTEIKQRVMATGQEERGEHTLPVDGALRSFSYIIKPHHDAQGEIIGVITAATDVTLIRQAEEQANQLAEHLRRQTAQLASTNKELETFSYSVSHDLRAPLRSLDGFSLALEEDYGDKLDEQGRDYTNRIRAAAQRMARLIDDLLQLSRSTRAEMRYSTVNLSAQAESVIAEFRQTEPERNVETSIQENMIVEGDESLLRQVLQNLLGNAWKFTAHTKDARIEFGEKHEDDRRIFFVRDNGAGFNMNYTENLFAPFRRLHSDAEFPGTGIGLSIVQRIIQRHGGDIWAEGAPGKGATFYFSLPSYT